MIFKNIDEIPSFKAADDTILKEVLHPDNDGVDLPYSLAQAQLPMGTSSLPHALKSAELYLFRSGKGQIFIEGESKQVKAGDLVLVPPGASQYVENTGKELLDFLVIVSPAWKEDEEEVF